MSDFSTAFTNPQMQSAASSYLQNASLANASSSLSGAGALGTKPSTPNPRANKPKILKYPQAKLEQADDYMMIKVIRYTRRGIKTGENNFRVRTATETIQNPNFRTILQTIILPMPKNLPADTNQVDWGNGSTLNPLEAKGAESLINILKINNILTGTVEELQNALKTANAGLVSGNAQSAINSVIISSLLGSLGSNVNAQSLLSRTTGQVLNPNLELLFSGVNLRGFDFQYDLSPRDDKESKVIKEIIRTLKRAMAAKTRAASDAPGVGLFVSAPDVFEISYKSGGKDHPFLNRFKPCALTGMSIDYAGGGSYATYPDATPVNMIMSLSFKELNPIYEEDYNEGIGKDGVGY
jgi:hypothetical protein